MDNYQKLAYEYEILNSREDIYSQKEFFKKIVEENQTKTCLDCACGLGWHLDMLDELGVKCYGSDISEDMLSICKENLVDRDITLEVGDFRELDTVWKQKFDMIICVTSAINHMQDDTEILRALQSMQERLTDSGVLIIATGVSDALIINKPKLIPAKLYSDKAVYFFLEYIEDKVVFNIFNIRKTEDSFEHSLNSMTLNLIGREKLMACISKAGFHDAAIYGDFEFSNYEEDNINKRLIVIAKK